MCTVILAETKEETDSISLGANTFGKVMNLIILSTTSYE